MEIDYDKPVVPVELCDEGGEVVFSYIGSELAIQFVHRFGGQGVVIDDLDGGANVVGNEEIFGAVAEVILQALVSPVAGTPPGTEATRLKIAPLLFDDHRRSGDKRVVVCPARQRHFIRLALRLPEDPNGGF